MNAEDLLDQVEALGVEITLDRDGVLLRPRSRLPAELVEELRAHTTELRGLLELRGWPEASREAVRGFGVSHARLYPFLGRTVATPDGPGRLLAVLPGRAGVQLEVGPGRMVYLLPSEVWPPDLTTDPGQAFEVVH